jgi:hypothetical protein
MPWVQPGETAQPVAEDEENTRVRLRDEKQICGRDLWAVRRAREDLCPELSFWKQTREHDLQSIHLQTDIGNGMG